MSKRAKRQRKATKQNLPGYRIKRAVSRRELAESLLRRNPGDEAILRWLHVIYRTQRDFAPMAIIGEQLLVIDPDEQSIRAEVLTSYIDRGCWALAIKRWEADGARWRPHSLLLLRGAWTKPRQSLHASTNCRNTMSLISAHCRWLELSWPSPERTFQRPNDSPKCGDATPRMRESLSQS